MLSETGAFPQTDEVLILQFTFVSILRKCPFPDVFLIRNRFFGEKIINFEEVTDTQ